MEIMTTVVLIIGIIFILAALIGKDIEIIGVRFSAPPVFVRIILALIGLLLICFGLIGVFPGSPPPIATAEPPTATQTAELSPTATSTPLPTDTAVPLPTPTNTFTATSTNTPEPKDTPISPTDTPEPTATPTLTPIPATDTPEPTSTFTATPIPPTDTPTPMATPTSARVLQETLEGECSAQQFTGGYFHGGHTPYTYALYDDGTWVRNPVTWQEGLDPVIPSCTDDVRFGFGKHYCQRPDIAVRIGEPINASDTQFCTIEVYSDGVRLPADNYNQTFFAQYGGSESEGIWFEE